MNTRAKKHVFRLIRQTQFTETSAFSKMNQENMF